MTAPVLNNFSLLDENHAQLQVDAAASLHLHDQWSHDPVLYQRRFNAVYPGTIDSLSLLDPYRMMTRINAALA